MVILIAGATHTGKTLLAQRLMEKYGYPYVSIDHLKMGLIRSGHTALTPESPAVELQAYLWPVVREMVKTAIENRQNLIMEGCYIPYTFAEDFEEDYCASIQALWLIFSQAYLEQHFVDILRYESVIEQRAAELQPQDLRERMMEDSRRDRDACKRYGLPYVLIDQRYHIDLEALMHGFI